MQKNMDSGDTEILEGKRERERERERNRNSACLGLYNKNTTQFWPLQTRK